MRKVTRASCSASWFVPLLVCLAFSTLFSQVKDSVIVTVTTVTYGGRYAPKNASMIWIQKPDKTFIKTIGKKAQNYIRYCTLWNSISKGDVDGLTGASRSSHGVLTGRWDCTGQDNKPVPNGTYEFWVEMTEANATGKNSFGTITIDGIAKTVKGTETTYLKSFSAVYKVTSVNTMPLTEQPALQSVTFEQRNGRLKINLPGSDAYTISLLAPNGKICHTTRTRGTGAEIDMNSFARGIYILNVTNAKTRTLLSQAIFR